MGEITQIETELLTAQEKIKSLESEIKTIADREDKLKIQFLLVQRNFSVQRQQLDAFFIQNAENEIEKLSKQTGE